MNSFVLETIKPALRWGIVPAVSFPTHRADHAEFLELVLKRMARVLAASIRVMHHACGRSTTKPSHRQRIRHSVSRHPWLERPANHFSDRSSLIFQDHQLYLTTPGKPEAAHVVHMSDDLRHAMSTASTVLFPESHSLDFAGKEYALIIIGHPSSLKQQGFCGAGEEDELYVVELEHGRVETRYENLIRSCLENIELESDGTASPFKFVAWTSSPAGFRVAWLSDAQGAESVQTYKIDEGRFIPIEH